ncbi:MAG: hypothetical protein ACRDM7_16275 [Thermoleophilaceae bacterium]
MPEATTAEQARERLERLQAEVAQLEQERLEEAPPVIRALVRLGELDEREEDHDG